MVKKNSRKHKLTSGIDKQAVLYVTHYEITDEPIKEPAYQRLPKSVRTKLDTLYQEAHINPEQTIPELLKLKKKYPNVPQIYNYLAVAYSRAGEIKQAEAITQENIRRHPNYLFARINQAQFYLKRKEYDKIPEIFNDKYDLQMLYPKRKRFHISEVANFLGIMGIYFCRTNQRDIAEKYNEILQEIAPDFPIAKVLNRELNPGLMTRILKHLLGEQSDDES